MIVRFALPLTTFAVLVATAPSASAGPEAGAAAVGTSSLQESNPFACSIGVVAERLTRCDYLVAHLDPTA